MSTCLPAEVPPLATMRDSSLVMTRVREYVGIVKPRIALMVVVSVAAGYFLGAAGSGSFSALPAAMLGVALVAASSTAFNHWYERDTDALMVRTRLRPLPAGRLAANEVLAFAAATGVAGLVVLWVQCNEATTLAALATLVLYAFCYTPAKRLTSLCTAIGAIPGAMPMVLGWLAAGQSWDLTGLGLFGVMYLWQFPHFLAIAWKYRDEYAGAGLKMLPQVASIRGATGTISGVYIVALLPVSVLPVYAGAAGTVTLVASLVLGLWYGWSVWQFAANESALTARRVILTSLVYLPAYMLVLVLDHWRGITG